MPENNNSTRDQLVRVLNAAVLSTPAAALTAALPTRGLAAALRGVTDDVTQADISKMLKDVNAKRTAEGLRPVGIHHDLTATPLGRTLQNYEQALAKMPLIPRTLMKILVPAPSLKSLEKSPGFFMDARGFDPLIYRNPKTTLGATGSVMAHELGHATPGAKFMGLRGLAGLLPVGLADLGYTTGRGKKRTKADTALQAGLIGAGGAGAASVFNEEARATRNAKRMLKAMGRTPKGLSRGLATYAVGTLGAAGAGAAGYGVGGYMKKKAGATSDFYEKNAAWLLGAQWEKTAYTHAHKVIATQKALAAGRLKEAEVTLDINRGDVLLGGKYKNSPITVEEIGTDELGQPTVNGRKLLAYRIKKKMPEKTSAEKLAIGSAKALRILKSLNRRYVREAGLPEASSVIRGTKFQTGGGGNVPAKMWPAAEALAHQPPGLGNASAWNFNPAESRRSLFPAAMGDVRAALRSQLKQALMMAKRGRKRSPRWEAQAETLRGRLKMHPTGVVYGISPKTLKRMPGRLAGVSSPYSFVAAHELGHITDAGAGRVPGWTNKFLALPPSAKKGATRYDKQVYGGSMTLPGRDTGERYADTYARGFTDWAQGAPETSAALQRVESGLGRWSRSGYARSQAPMATKKTSAEKLAKFLISKGPATAEEYLAALQKALSKPKPGPTPALGYKPKPKAKKPAKDPDDAALLERLVKRQRSGSGYVAGD